MEKLKPTICLKRYFEKDARKVDLAEMRAFIEATTPEERRLMATQAAQQLGVELDLA